MNMKFVKGMIVGGMITAGIAMACTDGMCSKKKKMVKMGKQFMRKMGML